MMLVVSPLDDAILESKLGPQEAGKHKRVHEIKVEVSSVSQSVLLKCFLWEGLIRSPVVKLWHA